MQVLACEEACLDLSRKRESVLCDKTKQWLWRRLQEA